MANPLNPKRSSSASEEIISPADPPSTNRTFARRTPSRMLNPSPNPQRAFAACPAGSAA